MAFRPLSSVATNRPASASTVAKPSLSSSTTAVGGSSAGGAAAQQRVPIHLRGVKPPPPHPTDVAIAAAEAFIPQLEDELRVAYQMANQTHDTILRCIQSHQEQLRNDKRKRDEEDDVNRERLVVASAEVELAEAQLAEQQGLHDALVVKLRAAERALEATEVQIRDTCIRIEERRRTIEQCALEADEARRTIESLDAAVGACRRIKLDHLKSLDAVKEQVRRDQKAEAAAVAELQKRRDAIHSLKKKTEALRRQQAPNHSQQQNKAGAAGQQLSPPAPTMTHIGRTK